MKTPIEQFEEKFGTSMTMLEIKILIKELKIKEKQMIIDAYNAGFDSYYTTEKTAEQYYNETFKQ